MSPGCLPVWRTLCFPPSDRWPPWRCSCPSGMTDRSGKQSFRCPQPPLHPTAAAGFPEPGWALSLGSPNTKRHQQWRPTPPCARRRGDGESGRPTFGRTSCGARCQRCLETPGSPELTRKPSASALGDKNKDKSISGEGGNRRARGASTRGGTEGAGRDPAGRSLRRP